MRNSKENIIKFRLYIYLFYMNYTYLVNKYIINIESLI